MELVHFCGLGLRTLVSTEASVQRRDTTPGWVIFTFLSHLLAQTRLISKRAAAILLKLHGNRDQFAWCRRKTVVYGNGWIILVIISIHYHVHFVPFQQL